MGQEGSCLNVRVQVLSESRWVFLDASVQVLSWYMCILLDVQVLVGLDASCSDVHKQVLSGSMYDLLTCTCASFVVVKVYSV